MIKTDEQGEGSTRQRARVATESSWAGAQQALRALTGAAPAPGNLLRNALGREEMFDLPPPLPPAVGQRTPPAPPQPRIDGVVDVTAASLRAGSLYALFRAGAPAVRVVAEPALAPLWHGLMPASVDDTHTPLGEQLPWSSGLQALAANLSPASCVGTRVGDVVYASPRLLTYVARKILLHRPEPDGGIRLEPASFQQPGGPFQLPQSIADSVWSLNSRLLEALTPPGFELPRQAVTVERLMYDATLDALARRLRLLRSTGGRFSQLGHRIDDAWFDASGPFRRPLARYAYAFAALVPRLAARLQALNAQARQRSLADQEPEGAALFGEAHTDGRLFSVLVSQRDVVRTEFWTGGGWGELPVTGDSMVIFPGRLAQTLFGLRPTRHRILHLGGQPQGAVNATLMFGLQQSDMAG